MCFGRLFYTSDQNPALFILPLKWFQSWSPGAAQVSLVFGTRFVACRGSLLSVMTGSRRFSGMFSAQNQPFL